MPDSASVLLQNKAIPRQRVWSDAEWLAIESCAREVRFGRVAAREHRRAGQASVARVFERGARDRESLLHGYAECAIWSRAGYPA